MLVLLDFAAAPHVMPPIDPPVPWVAPVVEVWAKIFYRDGTPTVLVTLGTDDTDQVVVSNVTANGTGSGAVEVLGMDGIFNIEFGIGYLAGEGPMKDTLATATLTGLGETADLVAAFPDYSPNTMDFHKVFDSRVLDMRTGNDIVRVRTNIPVGIFTGWNKGAP